MSRYIYVKLEDRLNGVGECKAIEFEDDKILSMVPAKHIMWAVSLTRQDWTKVEEILMNE